MAKICLSILCNFHLLKPSGADLKERERESHEWGLEAKYQFSAQELDLGGLDETQDSQPLIHQGLEAGNKVSLALACIEKCISQEGKMVKKKKKEKKKCIFRDTAQQTGKHRQKLFC